MALPKIDLPLFEMTLPTTQKVVKYRQYTVKEEKILLVANESKDAMQEILALKQVVNNCLIDIDVEDLPMVDIEYAYLILRSKSVDNSLDFNIKDPETDETIILKLEIDDIQLNIGEDFEESSKIKLNDDYTLFLKLPNIDNFIKIIEMDPKDPLVNYFILISCLDKVASEDEIHEFKNYTRNEIDAFMETLTNAVISKIQKFFENMPRLRHEMKYVNSNGNEKTFVIEGMRTFFI
jgi:hypothetical protein